MFTTCSYDKILWKKKKQKVDIMKKEYKDRILNKNMPVGRYVVNQALLLELLKKLIPNHTFHD